MISNLEAIKSIIEFNDNEVFYFVQVLQRKKDNPEQSNESIKRYARFVKTLDGLEIAYNDSKMFCDLYNSRAYINLCPISAKKFSKKLHLELTKRLYNDCFLDAFKLPDKVALDKDVFDKNIWMLDVDIPMIPENSEALKELDEYLSSKPEIVKLGETKSPNGKHIIVKPFDFRHVFSDTKALADNNYVLPNNITFGLKLNSMTLLYSPHSISKTTFKKVDGLYLKA